MLTIDGSFGEGGGQILRSSLALSLVTGTPFRIKKIRANRGKPGLLRQHLTCVRAAAEIGQARTTGAELRSGDLTFRPGAVRPGEYRFAVGTAGSACLVLQSVLPALLRLDAPSTLHLEGGTHNDKSPPYDFIEQVFLRQLQRMGPQVTLWLDRHGFYPAGGGRFSAQIQPCEALAPIDLVERGEHVATTAVAVVSGLPLQIAHRELKVVKEALGLDRGRLRAHAVADPVGPGNVLMLTVEHEHVTELFVGFGHKRLRAEDLAKRVVDEAATWSASGVPVGEHLADQLLLPMALAGGGRFRTGALSLHTRTNIAVIQKFLDVRIAVEEIAPGAHEIQIG